MPTAPLGYCLSIGCNQIRIKDKKFCLDHIKQTTTTEEKARNRINSKVYNTNWKRLRLQQLAAFPLCQDCLEMIPSRIQASQEVHHVKEAKEYPELMFDTDNLRCLCVSCHSKLTKANSNNKSNI